MEQVYQDCSGVWGGVCNGDAVCLCGAFQDKPFSTGASHVCSATSGFILDDCPADDVVIRIDNGGAFRLKARRGNAVISGDNGQVAVRLADERPVLLDLADHFLAIYQDRFQFAIVRRQKANKGLSTFGAQVPVEQMVQPLEELSIATLTVSVVVGCSAERVPYTSNS